MILKPIEILNTFFEKSEPSDGVFAIEKWLSVYEEVEEFFRGFEQELIPYFTVNKAALPLEILLKIKKRELF